MSIDNTIIDTRTERGGHVGEASIIPCNQNYIKEFQTSGISAVGPTIPIMIMGTILTLTLVKRINTKLDEFTYNIIHKYGNHQNNIIQYLLGYKH